MATSGKPEKPRTPRKDRRGISPIGVAIVVFAITAVLVFLGFTRSVPFRSGFEMQAVFQDAVSLKKNSPVRIAGVNVGKVKSLARQAGTNATVVTLELQKAALPIHKDATLKIRPRIFLEGNFFVDVSPGTPSAPTISDGDTIPIAQTAFPVQLDQVLGSLQRDQRTQLQALLEGFGQGLTFTPSREDDQDADPSARGESAAKSLNDAAADSGPALRGTAIVSGALLGEQRNDLSRLIAGLDDVVRQLDGRQASLTDLIANLNTTTAALADERVPLQRAIRLLGPTLSTTDRALTSLNAALPPTRGLAQDLIPAMRQLDPTIRVGFPWVRQTSALLRQSELRGLVQELRPTTRDLSRFVDRSLVLLPALADAAQCSDRVLLPAANVKIDDGALSSGQENYKELIQSLVGFAGESQNFDGNGQYLRLQPGGGPTTIRTGGAGTASGSTLYANVSAIPQGTKPAYPRTKPPLVSNVACRTQSVPAFNSAKVGPADGTPAASQVSSAAAPGAAPANPFVARAKSPAKDAGDDSVAGKIVESLSPWKASK